MKSAILQNQARLALEIIHAFKGISPFHLYLQQYFRKHGKFGSKDRKNIRNLCFVWFRIGKNLPLKEEISLLTAHALFYNQTAWFEEYYEESLPKDPWSWIANKFPDWEISDLFPLSHLMSSQFKTNSFYKSLVNQPLLWIWSKYHIEISQYYQELGIEIIRHASLERTLGLPNGTNLDTLPDKWLKSISVQDLSSQVICSQIQLKNGDAVWDCCAASGGKSLNLYSRQPEIKLFVSDIRDTILLNLKQRFINLGVRRYHAGIVNLEEPADKISFVENEKFPIQLGQNSIDVIILDAPCSGSGTWARNPEGMLSVHEDRILQFQQKQINILHNTWPFLIKGGLLYYITCSVYEVENEKVIEKFNKEDAKLINMEYFQGYSNKADQMFCAVFKKI